MGDPYLRSRTGAQLGSCTGHGAACPAVPPGADPMSVMLAAITPEIATAVTKGVTEALARRGAVLAQRDWGENVVSEHRRGRQSADSGRGQLPGPLGVTRPLEWIRSERGDVTRRPSRSAGQLTGTPMQMASQAAQIPMQLAGMAASIPQGSCRVCRARCSRSVNWQAAQGKRPIRSRINGARVTGEAKHAESC